jgi:hypothetical protein
MAAVLPYTRPFAAMQANGSHFNAANDDGAGEPNWRAAIEAEADTLLVLNTRICGVACVVRVTDYEHQEPFRGSAWACNSDIDYRGGTRAHFDVLDLEGRPAPELERSLSALERGRIVREIHAAMQEAERG